MNTFETKYGKFSADGNEYIIKTPNTPKPWINVISNGRYGLVISQTGGGFSWGTHSEFNRLNRWHQDLVLDNWGKFFFFKNNITGEFWNPTWGPSKIELNYYECRFGFGYAKYVSTYRNINVELTVFVPLDEEMEIWNFKILNNTKETVDLSIFTYFEWCLGSSADHHREFHKTFLETKFDTGLNAMLANKRLWEIPINNRGHWNIEYPYTAFISSNKNIVDYEGDKENFIGQYGSVEKPKGIFKENLTKRTGKWNDSIATIKVKANLQPGEEETINFYIGIKSSINNIKISINNFLTQEQTDQALQLLADYWNNLLAAFQINTPDEAMNLMTGKWLRYQAISGRLWARTAYYQQSGAFGFRDQLQDSLVFLPINPELTKKQISLHARHQKQDGSVLHWWHPITETGLETNMTDDLLWLPFLIVQYLFETNDYAILDSQEPYFDNKDREDSLFNHSIAAIEKVLSRLSERGLPLIGAGDWNDGLSAVGLEMKGESIWLAEFLYYILIEFSSVCANYHQADLYQKYKTKAAELKKAFDQLAWDGEWFYRATKDNGQKIGSRENEEGKIYLNPQIWSVISGIAENDKQIASMDAVKKYLLKNNGALLLHPAYTKPDEMIGYLSRYAPGRRENGGVYTHAATWSIWAFAKINDCKSAFESYKRLCPVLNGMDADKYSAEPFVTPGNIDGPDSPNYGMAGWTWYTGSAAWFQKVIVDFILGVRAVPEGLLIDPKIPGEWESYNIVRSFRGCTYKIHVENPNHVESGVLNIILEGEEIKSNIIPPQNKKEINVTVILGTK